MLTFFGHLHPVLVHLPIGLLLVALLLEWLAVAPARASWKPAADLTLGLGVFFAAISCVTGLVLSSSGDYPSGLVSTHQWMGISLFVVSLLLFLVLRGRPMGPVAAVVSVIAVLLVFFTGHLGGSLTHGTDYLSLSAADEGPSAPLLRPVPAVQDAVAYTSLVQPVLHDNCYRCHSGSRVKGGLRLDDPSALLKGGKDGSGPSLIVKRILLPLDDEHHMAPKDKPQLTSSEVAVLRWWVSAGAPFDKKVRDLPQDSGVAHALLAFQQGTAGPTGGSDGPFTVADSDMPLAPVAPASVAAIARLEAAGALVLPIASGSPYLDVRFPNDTLSSLDALSGVADNVVSLKLSDLPVGDSALALIARCHGLVRLWLDHTHVRSVGALASLTKLRYLNLSSTAVSDVTPLAGLPSLRELFLYGSAVDKSRWAALKAQFPHTLLDSGGYTVSSLPTDTAIVRAPKR